MSLPAVPPHRRRAWYGAMAQTLARIHSLELGAAKLQDLREHGEGSLWSLSSPVCQHFKLGAGKVKMSSVNAQVWWEGVKSSSNPGLP